MTVVFDQSSVLTNNSSFSLQNNRAVIKTPVLSPASGCNQIRVTYLFLTGGTGGYAVGSHYVGQMGGSAPDFAGDQVQLLFGGNPTFSSPAVAASVTSDWVTLAQNFDATVQYVVSFFIPSIGGNLASGLGFSSTDMWTETASHTDSSSQTSASPALTLTNPTYLWLVAKIEVQAPALLSVPQGWASEGAAFEGVSMVLKGRNQSGWRCKKGLYLPAYMCAPKDRSNRLIRR